MRVNIKEAARLEPEAALDIAVADDSQYSVDSARSQKLPCPLAATASFDELLRSSTPNHLMVQVWIHRRYLPNLALPERLQRALADAWRPR
jgi:hypothetical protein